MRTTFPWTGFVYFGTEGDPDVSTTDQSPHAFLEGRKPFLSAAVASNSVGGRPLEQ